MKFFIDTANIDEIKKGLDMGMVDGVTTNPSLVAREQRPFIEILKDICAIVEGPVSAEVVSLAAEGMLREARELAKLSDNIVIKIPMIEECKLLPATGIYAVSATSGDHSTRGMAVICGSCEKNEQVIVTLFENEGHFRDQLTTLMFHKMIHGTVSLHDEKSIARLTAAKDEISELIY